MLVGTQTPRVHLAPPAASNDWTDVRDLAAAYGLVLDEWQCYALRAGLGVRENGQWAAPTVGANVPRQNGKGTIIEARELAGLLLFGEETIVHSAHEQKTARQGFERIKAYFTDYDDLRKKVRRVAVAVGREYITLKSGATLWSTSRSKGAFRGFSIDCLMLDEAQILGDPAWEAVKPALSARPNPQTWMLGTTPSPLDDAAVFTRTRARALDGAENLAWCEWSAKSGADRDDPAVWAMANPALGTRISVETVQSERNEMSDHGFGRERLGIWPVGADAARVIEADAWDACVSPGPPDGVAPDAMAIDASHDRILVVAACWVLGDTSHVELLAVDAAQDTTRATSWIAERAGRRIPVMVDQISPGASLVPALQLAKVKVVQTGANDMAKACGLLYDDVLSGRLTHPGQSHLDEALAGAKRRNIRDAGGWGWDRRDPGVNIAPLVAVTLARYGASLQLRRSGARTNGARTGSGRRALVL